jgi:ATP-dependent Clp protease ATP-binding subunit ClpC
VENELEQLIDKARSGAAEPFQELVARLRTPDGVPAGVLVELAHSAEVSLRRAAVAGARGRTEPEVLEAIKGLAADPAEAVRESLAEALEQEPYWPLDDVVERLLYDDSNDVRRQAVRAARWRLPLEGVLVVRLGQDSSWLVRQEIARALATRTPRTVLPALLAALGNESDADVQQACAASTEKHFNALGGYPPDLTRPPLSLLEEAQRRVAGFRSGYYPALASWLQERVTTDVDVEQLAALGTVLSAEAEAGRLPRAYSVDEACAAVKAVLSGGAPRAAVLLGESGSGKTAVVYELVHRLRRDPDGPWHVLRIAPAEILAGTHWLGEWQTKVQNIVKAVRAPRRVILYVPNLEELSEAGSSSNSDLNVATALAPHIERGDIAILGESTSEAFRRGLGAVRSLRRLFHAVEVRETGPPQTRAILQAVRDEAGADVPEAVLDRLVELADFYLAGTVQPGRAVGLLRRVLGGAAGPVTERHILNTLSTSTGIPADLLDDSIPLDRAKVRAFFEARVMGQPEAVDAVVDLVTLVKAGLTDPGKPFGVLFFVGPTGVGKTELARALAELLFGDPGRLIRFDMSEFSTYDSHERLLGGNWGSRPGLLATAVRERPFAVLLLDEIEKAHLNIYDLCLQIFDAGRLTDTQGRTADFRRTIIILTSNIGAGLTREGAVGFGQAAPRAPDRDSTLRELGRWFRPEFLNRLDRIVTFRPLGAETAEKIARREVARVLERSGIARRKLAVDVDPAVLPLLLREGYSPTFGARPLKRTVERLVLLPVAQAIAAGHVPPGALLRLVARHNRVEIEVSPPEAAEGAARPEPAAPRAVPVTERARAVSEQVAALHARAAPLAARKSELLARSAAPGFWDDRAASRRLLDEVYRLDGVLGALDNLDKAVRDEADYAHKHRSSDRDLARVEERLDGLESEARHLAFLVGCRDARDLGDALVTLRLVSSQGSGLDAVGKLAQMYAGLARRRGLECEVLDDRQGGEPPEDAITLLLCGAGAYALLCGESGLHQVARGRGEARRKQVRPVDRDVVRVEVLPVPAGDPGFAPDEVRVETRPLGEARGRLLARPKFEVQLFHAASMTSVRAWTDGPKGEAAERLRPLLRARLEAARDTPANAGGRPPLVRRYTLGPTTLVRDLRTGLSTGRLDQVLEGRLDLFLTPPQPGAELRP